MAPPTLRAGVVGCGAIGTQGHIPGLIDAAVEVVGVCDPAPGRAAAAASEFGIAHAFESHEQLFVLDLDIVLIGVPNVFHAPIAIAALESGANVLCEKPMAVSSAEGEAMIAAAQKTGKLLSVNQHLRLHPTAQAMRAAVVDGTLGDVYLTDVRWMRSAGIPGYGSWFTRRELAGAGAVFDIGVHMLDLALFVLGFPAVERVSGRLSSYLGTQGVGLGSWGMDRGDAVFDVDDTAVATLALAGGGVLRMHVAWAAFGQEEERITLLGTRGGADRAPGLYGAKAPLQFFSSDGPAKMIATPFAATPDEEEWDVGIKAFVAAVRGEAELAVPPEEPLAVLRLLEHIIASSDQAREIVLA